MQIGRFWTAALAAVIVLAGQPAAAQDEGEAIAPYDAEVVLEIHRGGLAYDAVGDAYSALSMFGQACDMGLPAACAMAGQVEHELASNGKEHIRAARMFATACRAGDDHACAMTGTALGPLSRASSPQPDSALALALLAMGEECRHDGGDQGCVAAANMLGANDGVPLDLAEIKPFAERACAKEQYDACMGVAMMQADIKDATALREQDEARCRAGFASGCDNLVGPLMAGEQGETLVLEQACKSAIGIACADLGLLLSHGPDAYRDEAAARRYMRSGCDLFVAKACFAFGVMHKKGIGGPENKKRAVSLVAYACELGHAKACSTLAIIAGAAPDGEAGGLDADAARARACRLGDRAACHPPAVDDAKGNQGAGKEPVA